MRIALCLALAACSGATWDDTFAGQDARTTSVGDASTSPDASPQACSGLAASSSTVPITVTFPGHGTGSETIHIVAATGTCDLLVDTDTDGVVFASDAIPCAPLLAAGAPESGNATASGPDDLLFLWSYGTCTITDDYALTKK